MTNKQPSVGTMRACLDEWEGKLHLTVQAWTRAYIQDGFGELLQYEHWETLHDDDYDEGAFDSTVQMAFDLVGTRRGEWVYW